MKTRKLEKAKKGWFIGNYPHAAFRTETFEAALKKEKTGTRVERHMHRIATEITLVVQGRVRFNNNTFKKGDIVIIKPGESADYEVLKNAVTLIIKVPSVKNDKYFVKGNK